MTGAFVHVPRTGGTSIRRALSDLSPRMHWTIGYLRQQQLQRDSRSFSFIRNPFDRVVSLFLFDFCHGPYKPLPSLAILRERFHRFITAQLISIPIPSAWHFVSIDDCLAVDRIGRFENLQGDFTDICAWLGVQPIDLPHLNAVRGDVLPYPAYYDAMTRDAVRRCHTKDFEMFDYSDILI